MPNTVVSPFMTITVPVVLTDPGPDWATRIFNAFFTTVDQHDHTTGHGVPIVPAAMSINADLPFGSFNATALRSTRYTQQAVNLALGSDVGCLYDVLGNLVWNNASGTAVQITNGSSVNSASALTGPVVGTQRTVTTTYTVDSITPDYYLFADTTGGAFVMTLPSVPTNGRTLMIIDVKGNFAVNNLTLATGGTAKINGLVSTNKFLSSAWAMYMVVSNGTDWFVQGL